MIDLKTYKSGVLVKDPTGYQYFSPSKINDTWTWNNQEINSLLEKAAIKLGELNSYSKLVPNIDLFIQLHVTKEAVISSRIEGTQTRIDEAFLEETEISPERKNDWKEVNNYIKALNNAVKELENLPISSRLITQTHKIILDSVRGQNKLPGQYRKSQNWIGGSSPSDAIFVPPHHILVPDLMSDLEQFINNVDHKVPALIKIAIAHYQFETIHPFLDGNGRLGRLLITLFLVEQNILSKPLLYLSAYFEQNKNHYYDNLMSVRTKNDMTQWIKYFLIGVESIARLSCDTLSKVLSLQESLELEINTSFGRKTNSARLLLSYLFKMPIVTVNQVSSELNLSFKSANSLVSDFISAGILNEKTGQTRNRVFSFDQYLQLF